MNAEQFSDFRHAAVHDLMGLNKKCDEDFHINSWPRWDYDLERGTLTFSQDKMPKVIASIQVVGTTSTTEGTWLWGWANEKGAYRCPGHDGFVYLLFSSIRFASDQTETGTASEQVECATHGSGFQTYVCEHLISDPAQKWFSSEPDDNNKWPDAWCAACNAFFQEEGEWNEKNESKTKIQLLCHHCYERFRSQDNSTVGNS